MNRRVEQLIVLVSTHSHPKVAAFQREMPDLLLEVSTHSHPKVAARLMPV